MNQTPRMIPPSSVSVHPAIVYLAAPLTTYRTKRYDRALTHVRKRFPRATILDARSAWTSTADWRARWPTVLPTLAAAVVIADGEGWIGAGVVKEVDDALAAGVPVWYLSEHGALYPWDAVTLSDRRPDNWQRHVRVTFTPVGADRRALDSLIRRSSSDARRAEPCVTTGRTMEPHTPEWFAALCETHPHRAAMTCQVVTLAGRLDVCSICGDLPAPVYDDLDPPYLPLRLCDDCLTMQRDGFGERLRRRSGSGA